jgi:hypothetical protein
MVAGSPLIAGVADTTHFVALRTCPLKCAVPPFAATELGVAVHLVTVGGAGAAKATPDWMTGTATTAETTSARTATRPRPAELEQRALSARDRVAMSGPSPGATWMKEPNLARRLTSRIDSPC